MTNSVVRGVTNEGRNRDTSRVENVSGLGAETATGWRQRLHGGRDRTRSEVETVTGPEAEAMRRQGLRS